METMAEWCKEHGVKITLQDKRAGAFLEKQGQKFLVNFGYGNAVKKAKEEYRFNADGPSVKTLNGYIYKVLSRFYQWLTPQEIQSEIYTIHRMVLSDSTVTARLRDLRKPQFGGYIIEKQRLPQSNAYEYRLKKEK